MPRARKPEHEKRRPNPWIGQEPPYTYDPRIRLPDAEREQWIAFGFTLDEVRLLEKAGGRFAWHLRGLDLKTLSSGHALRREARKQLQAGLRTQKGNDGALWEWARSLNPFAFDLLALYIGKRGYVVLDALRADGPGAIKPSTLRAVWRAIPRAAKVELPEGRPVSEPARNFVYAAAHVWGTAMKKKPTLTYNTVVEKLDGPFRQLLHQLVQAAGIELTLKIQSALDNTFRAYRAEAGAAVQDYKSWRREVDEAGGLEAWGRKAKEQWEKQRKRGRGRFVLTIG